MPRRPRIEIAGYYHIVSRGVEQCNVFLEAQGICGKEDLNLGM